MQEVTLTREKFKAIREKLGLTQQQFAELLAYKSAITISKKELGSRKITARDQLLLKPYL